MLLRLEEIMGVVLKPGPDPEEIRMAATAALHGTCNWGFRVQTTPR